MKRKPQIVFDFLVLLFFAFLVWEAKEWDLQARLYPWVIGFPMLGLAVLQLGKDIRGERKISSGAAPVDIQFAKGIDPVLARERTIQILSWIFGFLAMIWLAGFPITIPTFVFLYLKKQAGESWFLSVLLTAVAWFIYWGLFERLLRLPMPDGQIFLWMGL